MKVSVLQDNLNAALKQIKNIVPKKPSLPILTTVRLVSYDAWLVVQATDLDTSLSVRVGAKVDQEGQGICLPYATLTKLIDRLPAERIDINVDYMTQTATFHCGTRSFDLKGISWEEYPPLPEVEPQFDVMSDLLLTSLEAVMFSAATKERPALEGVFLHSEGDGMAVVAADGYRLAIASVKTLDVPPEFKAIIPLTSLPAFKDFLRDAAGKGMFADALHVHVDTNRIGFESRRATFWTTLYTDSSFPSYQGIVPFSYDVDLVVDKSEMMDALKTGQVYNDGAFFTYRKHGDGRNLASLDMAVGSLELGEYRETLDIVSDYRESFRFAVDSKFLLEALQHVDGPVAKISLRFPEHFPTIRIKAETEGGIRAEYIMFGLNTNSLKNNSYDRKKDRSH